MAIEFQPYVGPRPFEQEDQAIFFGRDREARELLSLVIAQGEVLMYAQLGAGKTSLINAGLIPLLEEKGFEVLPLARVQGLIPEDIEPEEIPNLYVFNTLMSWAGKEDDLRRLAQMSLADFLKEREHPTDEEGLPSARIVIFDQFEELFILYPERWKGREGFFKQVHDALEEDPLLRVIFVIREDYIAQLAPYAPLLPEKLRTRFHLERLREGAALAAITGPLKDTGRSFAEGVAEQLVKKLLKVRVETAAGKTKVVTGEFVEPVQLQVVCQSLWRDLPPDVTVITQDHLQAFGELKSTDREPSSWPMLQLLPIISEIAAGKAKPTSDDVTEYIGTDVLKVGDQDFVVQMLEGSELKFVPEYRYFAVQVVGDSMVDAGIAPGDYVILAQSPYFELAPQQLDVVAAVIADVDEEARLKRFLRLDNSIILKPESPNPDHRAYEFSLQEFQSRVRIAGRAVAVLNPKPS